MCFDNSVPLKVNLKKDYFFLKNIFFLIATSAHQFQNATLIWSLKVYGVIGGDQDGFQSNVCLFRCVCSVCVPLAVNEFRFRATKHHFIVERDKHIVDNIGRSPSRRIVTSNLMSMAIECTVKLTSAISCHFNSKGRKFQMKRCKFKVQYLPWEWTTLEA